VTVRVCFVCLGNICRSPTAGGVLRHQLREAGLASQVEVDSAGTGGWHVGELPDDRARAEARRRGVDIDDPARQFERDDFTRFDLVIAMDDDNAAALRRMAQGDDHHLAKIRLLRSFDPAAPPGAPVPDPYYGGPDGFAAVFDLVEAACRGLLDHLVDEHGLRPAGRG
jgi:protein-tyrosine phosphatase